MEYELLWNGANDGHDGDLLREDYRVAEKIHPHPLPSRVATASSVVLNVLPFRQSDGISVDAIEHLTGLTANAIHTAIHKLRAGELLGSENIPDTARKFLGGRARQRYWRTR